MGIASYYRGNSLISRQFKQDRRDPIFEMMDDLNALPKYAEAIAPWGNVRLAKVNNVWWIDGEEEDAFGSNLISGI